MIRYIEEHIQWLTIKEVALLTDIKVNTLRKKYKQLLIRNEDYIIISTNECRLLLFNKHAVIKILKDKSVGRPLQYRKHCNEWLRSILATGTVQRLHKGLSDFEIYKQFYNFSNDEIQRIINIRARKDKEIR